MTTGLGFKEEQCKVLRRALAAAMNAQHPYRLGGVAVAAQTAWLHQAGLATRLAVGATAIVTLTARGLDVARGLDSLPGVARRAPGA